MKKDNYNESTGCSQIIQAWNVTMEIGEWLYQKSCKLYVTTLNSKSQRNVSGTS